jgi:hypothetical protein
VEIRIIARNASKSRAENLDRNQDVSSENFAEGRCDGAHRASQIRRRAEGLNFALASVHCRSSVTLAVGRPRYLARVVIQIRGSGAKKNTTHTRLGKDPALAPNPRNTVTTLARRCSGMGLV